MPRYDLPDSDDGSKQWIELTDRENLTRKELRATRMAFDTDGGIVAKSEAHTETVLSHCLVNWELKTLSGDTAQRPQKGNLKQLQDRTDALPLETWLAIENAINGEDGDGGYTRECLQPVKADEDPQKPSTA